MGYPKIDSSPTLLFEQTPPIPLLVLDTNAVHDRVAFGDPKVQPIVNAIERETLRLAASDACLQELRRAPGHAQPKPHAAAQALAFER